MEGLIQRSHLFHSHVRFPYRDLHNRLKYALTFSSSSPSSSQSSFLPLPSLPTLTSSDQLPPVSELSPSFSSSSHAPPLPSSSKEFQLLSYAQTTRPIAHSSLLQLSQRFLSHKQIYGSHVERVFYHEMTVERFLQRLLICRPVVFYTRQDLFLLSDGTDGVGQFDLIGTEEEISPFHLSKLISYDEMQISALLSMSVPTDFINSGSRGNRGRREDDDHHIPEGIYVGSVGARFERQGLMEWEHMVVTCVQNTVENGYGLDALAAEENARTDYLRIWSDFYSPGYVFPSYDEVVALKETISPAEFAKSFSSLGSGGNGKSLYLNNFIYKERMKRVIQPFLQEANQRALEEMEKQLKWSELLGKHPSIEVPDRLLLSFSLPVRPQSSRLMFGLLDLD